VVESVLADHRAPPDDDGQVVLTVVPPGVADSALGPPGEPVSPAAAGAPVAIDTECWMVIDGRMIPGLSTNERLVVEKHRLP
jgi:hypothetical protein